MREQFVKETLRESGFFGTGVNCWDALLGWDFLLRY